ncbi:unnamed protein product [Tenebrio molitor]|nr:unnamed protein product [Tenebrio molitor]
MEPSSSTPSSPGNADSTFTRYGLIDSCICAMRV